MGTRSRVLDALQRHVVGFLVFVLFFFPNSDKDLFIFSQWEVVGVCVCLMINSSVSGTLL